ncbi:uncharacterized protein LOC144636924 [Oculina patagonica]
MTRIRKKSPSIAEQLPKQMARILYNTLIQETQRSSTESRAMSDSEPSRQNHEISSQDVLLAQQDSSKKQLDPKLYYKLHSTDAIPASFYGLPKIHKADVPLRPITSAIGSPTYQLSKHLANILSPLQNNKYTVKNSVSFVEKIRTLTVNPDEIFVSFDVVSLFTCIPSNLAVEVVKERLYSDSSSSERTNLSVENIIKLLEFVLDSNFFVFQGTNYKQIFGCPMGSPVSAILANLVMEYVEEKALSSAPHPPKWWFRYVDDSHVCLKKEFVDEFHSHLNSINQHIKFTIEVETEGSIAFLDTKTTRQVDGSIAVSVYRKATHTDRYLDFNSYHHTQHKHSVVRTLMDRAKNIPSTEEEVSSESNRVLNALAANNYPINFIRNGRQSNAEQKSGANVVEQRGLVVLPYAKGFSERISRVLKGFNVKVAHKPIRSIANILKKPKDKISEESSKGVKFSPLSRNPYICFYSGDLRPASKRKVRLDEVDGKTDTKPMYNPSSRCDAYRCEWGWAQSESDAWKPQWTTSPKASTVCQGAGEMRVQT